MPSSSPSSRRKSSYTRSASTVRPVSPSAVISSAAVARAAARRRPARSARRRARRWRRRRGGARPAASRAPMRSSLQAHRLGAPVVDVVELGIGRAVPALEQGVDLGRARRVGEARRRRRSGEAVGVEVDRRRLEPVAVADRLDHVLGQAAPQPEQVVLQRGAGSRGDCTATAPRSPRRRDTTRPRRSTRSASSRRWSVPSGVSVPPGASTRGAARARRPAHRRRSPSPHVDRLRRRW